MAQTVGGGGPQPPPDSLGELLSFVRDLHRSQRVVVHRMDTDDEMEAEAAPSRGTQPPPDPGLAVAQPLVSALLQTHRHTIEQMQAQQAQIHELRNEAAQVEHARAAEAMMRRVDDQRRHEATMAMISHALGTRQEEARRETPAHHLVNHLAASIQAAVPEIAPIAVPTPEHRDLAMSDQAVQEKRGGEGASEQPAKKKVLERPADVAAADSRRRTAELAAAAAEGRRPRAVDPDRTVFATYEPAKRMAPEKAMPYSKASGSAEKALPAIQRVVAAIADAPRRQQAESSAMASQDRKRSSSVRSTRSVASAASTVPYEDVVEMEATVAADTSGRPTVAARVAKGKGPRATYSRNMGQRFTAANARRLALQKFVERRDAVHNDVVLPVARKTIVSKSGITKGNRRAARAG
jgi:hypothetical protein